MIYFFKKNPCIDLPSHSCFGSVQMQSSWQSRRATSCHENHQGKDTQELCRYITAASPTLGSERLRHLPGYTQVWGYLSQAIPPNTSLGKVKYPAENESGSLFTRWSLPGPVVLSPGWLHFSILRGVSKDNNARPCFRDFDQLLGVGQVHRIFLKLPRWS